MQKKAFLMDSELVVHVNTKCKFKLNARFDAIIFISNKRKYFFL